MHIFVYMEYMHCIYTYVYAVVFMHMCIYNIQYALDRCIYENMITYMNVYMDTHVYMYICVYVIYV